MPELFRQEAIYHASIRRRYGTVILTHPIGYLFLSGLFLVISAGILSFFFFSSYQRKIHIPGVILPEAGLIRIVSSQAGVIMKRSIREGQAVKAGEILFVLSTVKTNANYGEAGKVISDLLRSRRQSLRAEENQLHQQSLRRIESMNERIKNIAKEVSRMDSQIDLQRRRVSLAEDSFRRFNDLKTQNFVSFSQVQDKQAEFLDQQQRLADLERTNAASSRDIDQIKADLKVQKIQDQRDLEFLARNIASVEQELSESNVVREIEVRAPQDGLVAGINAELGQAATTNQILASLLPIDGVVQAELYAPSRAVGFVRPGMNVLLRYQAYPYQKFGQHSGQVREVARVAMRPEEMIFSGVNMSVNGISEPIYRIKVRLDQQGVTAYGELQPLKSGMMLDASVLMEKRRLYEWALEPLYTITGRL